MRPLKRVPAKPSFFALLIHSEATRPIVPEDNTDLKVFTVDPQAPCQPQGVAALTPPPRAGANGRDSPDILANVPSPDA
ncbi:UNVERIFIED_CONTAM: hypothetical protein FKN15_067263 [Acipenser sinensis]